MSGQQKEVQQDDGFEPYDGTWTLRKMSMSIECFKGFCEKFHIKRKEFTQNHYQYQYQLHGKKIYGSKIKKFTSISQLLTHLTNALH